MPRININYLNTIIYKLVHKEDYDNANIYIGSTTDINKRKHSHKNSCVNIKDRRYNEKKYQYIRDNGGWDCFNIIEIEKYPCNDGNEARAREEYWRCYFNAQLNMVKAFNTRKICNNLYYMNNKEKLSKKITCECGCLITYKGLTRHRKTQKHIDLINKNIVVY